MTSAVARIVSWARRHRAAVVLGLVVLTVGSLVGLRRLSFDTDVLSLLPRDGQTIPAFRSFLSHFGSLDELYVVFDAPAGQSIGDYGETVAAWVEALREAPEITRVDSGLADTSRDLAWLADRQLLLLPDRSLQEALTRFQPAGMPAALAARRELLTVPSPEIAELVRQDPLGLIDLTRAALGGTQAGIAVGTGGGYVTADGGSRLVIAQPARPPYDAAFSRALMARLESIRERLSAVDPEAGVDDEPRPPLSVAFAGGHRIAVETESLVRRESIGNTVGSLALILPLLLLVFRSLWLVGVGPLPSAVSLLVVLGALGIAGATLSAAATASAAMLFGLGVDGVVLLYVAYTHAIRDGDSPAAAIDGLSGASYSMLLGMWTTAATFYGLTFVDFPSLEQLGRLIGHSMLVCGVLTLIVVPALLPRRPRPRRALALPGLARWVARHRRSALAAALVATLLLGAAASRLQINPTLERLRSVTPAAELAAAIAPRFGLPEDVYVLLAQGPDLDALLATDERIRAAAAASDPGLRIQGPSALLPSTATLRARQARIRDAHLAAPEVLTHLEAAAADAGFRPQTFAPFAERLPRLLDPPASVDVDGYQSHGLGDLIDRFVVRTADGWMTATYAFPADAAQAAALEEVARRGAPDATLTGLPLVNRELGERFLPQFLRGLGIGSVIVLAIVGLAFRDWWLSVLALLPTAIGLVWAAGLLALAGVELDLFALFAVVTFVGIGVDYGIHVVQRYRERGDAHRAVEELAPVILVAAAITIGGYGTLIASSYPPLRSIGVVSAVSIATLAVTSLIVLPALLFSRRTPGGRPEDR